MVTTPEKTPAERTRAEVAADYTERAIRTIVAGSEVGAVRRIILYFVVALALAFATPIFIGLIGLGALILLVSTDSLR